MNKLFYILSIAILLAQAAVAQKLQRRGFFGVDLSYKNAIVVDGIYEKSSAEKMGLKKGDLILQINDYKIQSDTDLFYALKQLSAGDPIQVICERNGKQKKLKGKLGELPKEQFEDAEVIYSQVNIGESQLRTIITKPNKKGKYPAVLLVQGIGCYSIDTPFDVQSGHIQILENLSKNGFVTIRIDKSGVGDSRGIPCDQLDFETELAGYQEGLKSLKTYNFVDEKNIFVIGHSVGGVMAPIVAKRENAKGVVVYGTIGKKWMEYLRENQEMQLEEKGYDYDEIEDMVMNMNECYVDFLVKQKNMDAVIEENPDCEEYLKKFKFRSDNYWHQLNALNVAGVWKDYDGFVLSMWGEYDWATHKEEHVLITKIVNKKNPNKASFIEVPNSDHKMMLVADSKEKSKAFNTQIAKIIVEWTKTKMGEVSN